MDVDEKINKKNMRAGGGAAEGGGGGGSLNGTHEEGAHTRMYQRLYDRIYQ